MSSPEMGAPVEVITSSNWIRGFLVNRGRRITDVLNDATVSVVELRDATVGVAHGKAKSLGREPSLRCEQLWLRKADIIAAQPVGPHEAPQRRATYYQTKNRYPAMLVVAGCMISGILHLSRPISPHLVLAENSPLSKFIPMTDVVVHASNGLLTQASYEVLIVHRETIQAAQVAQSPLQVDVAETASTGA